MTDLKPSPLAARLAAFIDAAQRVFDAEYKYAAERDRGANTTRDEADRTYALLMLDWSPQRVRRLRKDVLAALPLPETEGG